MLLNIANIAFSAEFGDLEIGGHNLIRVVTIWNINHVLENTATIQTSSLLFQISFNLNRKKLP